MASELKTGERVGFSGPDSGWGTDMAGRRSILYEVFAHAVHEQAPEEPVRDRVAPQRIPRAR